MRLMISLRLFSILNKSSTIITRNCGLLSQDACARKINVFAWNFSSCFYQHNKRLLESEGTISISLRCQSAEKKDSGHTSKVKNVNKESKKENVDHSTIVKDTDMVNLFSSEDLLIGKRTLADARDYAKQKGFRLARLQGKNVNIVPSYKLVTSSMLKEYQKSEKRKTEKTFVIKGNIANNDLLIKINQIIKYLEKGTSVVVKITRHSSGGKSVPVGTVLKKIGEKLDHIAYTQSSITNTEVSQTVFVPRENLTQKGKDL